MNNYDAFKIWELETRIKELEGNDLDNLISQFNDHIDKITNKACEQLDDIRPRQRRNRYYSTLDEMYQKLSMGSFSDSARQQAAAYGMANQTGGLQDYYRAAGSMGFIAGILGTSLLT